MIWSGFICAASFSFRYEFSLRDLVTMSCCCDSFLLRGATFSLPEAHYCLHGHQFPHSYQVVSGGGEDEDPVDAFGAAMAQLAQQAHRLQPAEDLFDPFALLLTDLVARMAGGAAIDGRAAIGVVLGHVRRHLQFAQVFHEIMGVIVLVTAHGYSTVTADLCREGQGRIALRRAGRRSHASRDRQAVAILHQQMPGVSPSSPLCLCPY